MSDADHVTVSPDLAAEPVPEAPAFMADTEVTENRNADGSLHTVTLFHRPTGLLVTAATQGEAEASLGTEVASRAAAPAAVLDRGWPGADPAERQRFLWACRCGRGGVANIRRDRDTDTARAEVEQQVIVHLREDERDYRHNVHVGTFTDSFLLTPPPLSSQAPPELGWRKAGDTPDFYGPHPYLS